MALAIRSERSWLTEAKTETRAVGNKALVKESRRNMSRTDVV